MDLKPHETARASLEALCAEKQITMSCRILDKRPGGTGKEWDKLWDSLAGHVEFTLRQGYEEGSHSYNRTLVGHYSAGSEILRRWALDNVDKALPIIGRGAYIDALKHGRQTAYYVEALGEARKKWRPCLVDVVGALFVDASGMEGCMSLREWCDELGMEWKNPSDAVEAFEACQRAYRFLVIAFGRDFDKAKELAHEL